MLSCQACGYESPTNAKFCRQCGALLLAENEMSEAKTLNYGRQGSAPLRAAPPAASAPLPPSIADAISSDTARYQSPLQAPLHPVQPPMPAARPNTQTLPQPMYVPPVVDTKALKPKRRWRILKWGGFVLSLLIAGGIGAAINEEANRGRDYIPPEDRARLERLRTEENLTRTVAGSVVEYHERFRERLERQIEDIQRAKEDAERAAERGAPLDAGEKPLDLNEYEYEGATAGSYSRIPGRELLTQRTRDDLETVSQFYQKKLGKPLLQINRRNETRLIFQSAGAPSVTVLVRENHDNRRQFPWEIIILRSPFRLPKAPDAIAKQPAEAPGKTTVLVDGKPIVTVETKPAKPAAPAAPAKPEEQE